jgi:hypothetical protein
MIELISEHRAGDISGKVAPLPTAGGKLLPLAHDSFLKRIAYVITYHALRRYPRPAGGESAPSWPWPRPQKGLTVGSHCQFEHHDGSSRSGGNPAKPFGQLVQFAAAGHRRPTLGSGCEPGRIGHRRRLWFRHGWSGCRGSPQDKCYGLIPRSRIAASSCSALKGLLKNSMACWPENLLRSVAWS